MFTLLRRACSFLKSVPPPPRSLVLIFCLLFIAFRIVFVPADSHRGRSVARGDGFSDENILASARYFKEHGFTESYFQPMVGYGGQGKFREGIPKVYLHYPPLPDIIAGLTASVFGTLDPRILRLVPFVFSIAWFFLIYATLSLLVADRRLAEWSAVLLVTSNYFLAWADNLCYHMYSELLVWAFVFLLFRKFHGGARGWKTLGLPWLAYFAAACTSFDAIVYGCIVTVGFSLVYGRGLFSKEVVLLGTAPIPALGLRFTQNALYLGGVEAAVSDLTSALFFRTVGGDWEGNPMWLQLWRLPMTYLNRVERFFWIPGIPFAIFAYFALRFLERTDKERFRVAAVVLLATLAWPIVMWQHAAAHTFTSRTFGILFGMTAVLGLSRYLEVVLKDVEVRNKARCLFHSCLLVYLFLMGVSQQVLQLYLVNGFLFPWLGR